MMPKKMIPITELKAGMVSSMNIYFEGSILLAKNLPITEPIIDKLKKAYIISSVEVYFDAEFDKPLTSNMQAVKKLENTFNDFSSNLRTIFDNLSVSRTPKLDDIRIFVQKVKNEFAETETVIQNIIFYGSRNDSIYRHTLNVVAISFILGKWLDLNNSELNLLIYAAILHDFGKVRIDKNIVYKKGKLTDDEYETLKSHTIIGYHFVKQIEYLSSSVPLSVLLHHERSDGSGYPLHITQDMIPSFARIIAIADLFDEVSSNRYSMEIRGPLEALKIIQDQGLTRLDFNYCNTFMSHMLNYYMGANVLLNNKRSCRIIKFNMDNLAKPLLLDADEFIDLNDHDNLYVKKIVI